MKCANCGTELPDGVKFCHECGEKQGPAREALLSEQEVAEIEARSRPDEYAAKLRRIVEEGIAIERRDVAVMFVDVSGFTALFTALPADQLREVMRDVYSVMSGAITRCGGYVDKFFGDEAMAIFGAPIALEHPCERAITAVDEIEIGLTGVNHRFRKLLSTPLSVHAGIAFGRVEAGRLGESQKLEYAILGETVNLAKRLTDAAFAKTVFVSSKVKFLTAEAFDFESLGVQQFPGVSRSLEVFRVVGPKSVSGERVRFSQLGASMFGRDAEFESLKAEFEKIRTCYPDPKPCKAGEGKFRDFSHILGITGEAGIGKSRLRRELKRHAQELLGKDGVRVLTGGAWGVGQTPLYWPIKEQIASALGFELTARTEVIGERLSRLTGDERFDQEHVPYVHHLFGLKSSGDPLAALEPKSIKDNLWIAIRKLYERWSLERPLVLVFEDMHWTDGGTEDFVEYLAEFVAGFPVLVLLLYRSGYEPKFAQIERIPFTEMKLGPLSKGAETGLLSFYLADGKEERALIRRIRKYSEGNPLFAEEFLHMLLDRGKMRLEDGKMHLTEEVQGMPLPTGLSGVLGERFDRLAREDKRVAYYGAVIGRSFLRTLLLDLHGRLHGVPNVSDALNTLLAREIVFQRAVEPDLEYTFKHALTREMLVSRLVQSLRRELSRLIAMRIEELYKDRLDEFHGTLSEHYEATGDIEKAARHAAFHAIHEQRQQRNFEALDAFERYDRLCDDVRKTPLSSEEEADLLGSRIGVLEVLGRWDDALVLCDHLARLENGKWQAQSLAYQSGLKRQMGDYSEALKLGERAVELARQHDDRKAEARSIHSIGSIHQNQGDYDQGLRCYKEALAIHQELGDKGGIARVVSNMGSLYAERGDYDETLRCYKEALATHQELGDKGGIA
ncbi:MAG: tetratricopeptide repeat protein, partial [Candidatus Coatesbacteria bacterium]|nr:tetratricopeptide repeat protein [Candidatus Coatesbacteria bacterium]